MSSTVVTQEEIVATARPLPQQASSNVSLILVACTGLWLLFLWHTGQNYQEQHSLQLAKAQHGLAAYGSPDDPMPLYYLLLARFTSIFGITLSTARLLSLVFLLLSVITAYFVGKRMSGDFRTGQLGAAFIGLSPFVLWYSSRATPYCLLLLGVLSNMYFFISLLQRPRWWHWMGYAFTALLGLSVHYIFLLVVILQYVFFLIKYPSFSYRRLLAMTATILFLLVAMGLWVHYSYNQTTNWQYLPYTSKPSATNAFILYVQYLFGFQSVVTITLIIALWPLLVVLALLALQKYIRPDIGVQYALWASTAPIFVIFALAWLAKPLFLTSYFIVCVPPFMLFLAWYFVTLNLRVLNLARNVILTGMAVAFFVQVHNQDIALQQDYLGLANRSQSLQLIKLQGIR